MPDSPPIVSFPEHTHPLKRAAPQPPRGHGLAASNLLARLGRWDAASKAHSDRVATAAASFGRFLELDAASQSLLERAAWVHDIGKLHVPKAILQKQGPLTDGEYKRVKTHAADGASILSREGFADDIVAIVQSHHEWWDGCGYPEGLSGAAIPEAARVIAIVDAWDAISAKRVYHRRRPEFLALTEIRKGAGTQFDPVLAPAFIDHVMRRIMGNREAA